jgi:pSer/pThr/pTyr-binding forkhead associated (FHA) protein
VRVEMLVACMKMKRRSANGPLRRMLGTILQRNGGKKYSRIFLFSAAKPKKGFLMIVAELTGARPPRAAPYYTLVVRDAYTVGRLDTSDIVLDHNNVSRQHATLTVMRSSCVPEHEHLLADGNQFTPGSGLLSSSTSSNPFALQYDPLVVVVTNYSKFGTIVDGHVITSSCIALSGSTIQFGNGGSVTMKITFRPLILSIARDFSEEYIAELQSMLETLGATVLCNGPVPISSGHYKPIGLLHCAEEVADDSWSLLALAHGYSIVLPTYPFEIFACLSEKPNMLLHDLPKQQSYATALKRHVYGCQMYLRPETDSVPFALFGISTTACSVQRSRRALFSNRVFLLTSELMANRNGGALAACGGTSALLPDVHAARRRHCTALSKYVVLDSETEELLIAAGTDPNVPFFFPDHSISLEESSTLGGRGDDDETDSSALALLRLLDSEGWGILPERALHVALLTNKFVPRVLSLPQQVSQTRNEHAGDENDQRDAVQHNDGDFVKRPAFAHAEDKVVFGAILSSKIDKSRTQASNNMLASPEPKVSGQHRHLRRLNGSPRSGLDDDQDEPADDESDRTPSDLDPEEERVEQQRQSNGKQLSKAMVPDNRVPDNREGGVFTTPPPLRQLHNHRDAAGLLPPTPQRVVSRHLRFGSNSPERIGAGSSWHEQREGEEDQKEERSPEGSRHFAETSSAARFLVLFEKSKASIRRLIYPEQSKVENVFRTAQKNKFVSAATATYLRRVLDNCVAEWNQLQALAESSEAVRHSNVLNSLAHCCRELHEKCRSALSFGGARKRMGISGTPPPLPAFYAPTVIDEAMNSVLLSAQKDAFDSGSLTAIPNSPSAAAIRDGTRIIRFPAAPLDATRERMRTHQAPGEAQRLAALRAPVAPSEVHAVAERRKMFIRCFGVDEGERRFATWLSAHPVEWGHEFYRHMEARGLNLYQLVHMNTFP